MQQTDLTHEQRREEERSEIEKHAIVYQPLPKSQLVMRRSDWERFDHVGPTNSYYGSMLRLGATEGKTVLDVGCGDGWLSVILAKRGARVSAFDLSPHAIEIAKERAIVNDVDHMIDFKVASLYDLPYGDAEFDLAIGQAILHHVRDKRKAACELRRVLRHEGRAVFAECFGDSELLERLRLLVPVPSASPEDPDHWRDQMRYADLDALRETFDVQWEEFQLLSRLDRVVRNASIIRVLNETDRALLRFVPMLRRLARTIVVELRAR